MTDPEPPSRFRGPAAIAAGAALLSLANVNLDGSYQRPPVGKHHRAAPEKKRKRREARAARKRNRR